MASWSIFLLQKLMVTKLVDFARLLRNTNSDRVCRVDYRLPVISTERRRIQSSASYPFHLNQGIIISVYATYVDGYYNTLIHLRTQDAARTYANHLIETNVLILYCILCLGLQIFLKTEFSRFQLFKCSSCTNACRPSRT
jgi:hypothetical protein